MIMWKITNKHILLVVGNMALTVIIKANFNS